MSKEHIDYEAEQDKRVWWLNNTGGTVHDNLTVRDYFAAAAMAASLNAEVIEYLEGKPEEYTEAHATFAYMLADAMMKERNK